MRMKLKHRILFCFLFLGYSCVSLAESLDVEYKKGRYLKDKIELGSVVKTDYDIKILKKGKQHCVFKISYVKFHKKLVTPVYEEIMVVKKWVYNPSPNEMFADIITAPLNILSGSWAGKHLDIQKNPTGRLIKGKTKVDGVIKGVIETPQEAKLSILVNDFKFSRHIFNGFVKVPSKLIADEYLKNEKVEVGFVFGDDLAIKNLDEQSLERILNLVYGLGL